jgi:hypothetical protein
MIIIHSLKAVSFIVAIHMWYDNECCANKDCHPVEAGQIRELREGVSVPGYGMLGYGDPRLRWSQDDRDHICVSQARNLICVYRQPKGF